MASPQSCDAIRIQFVLGFHYKHAKKTLRRFLLRSFMPVIFTKLTGDKKASHTETQAASHAADWYKNCIVLTKR
jgi:hypothetical protein